MPLLVGIFAFVQDLETKCFALKSGTQFPTSDLFERTLEAAAYHLALCEMFCPQVGWPLKSGVAKPNFIELPSCEPMPILFEDRSVLAIDKPSGWMLAPISWRNTGRNLQAAIESSIAAGDFWARSRGLKFLRHVHRLDAETSGVLLFAKSPGAVEAVSDLFERRKVEKTYLAVVTGKRLQKGRGRLLQTLAEMELAGGPPALPASGQSLKGCEWTCRLKLAPDEKRIGKMLVDARQGKLAETQFKILESRGGLSLVECKPVTGRTHQIRVHLAESGLPIVGDDLYGNPLIPFNGEMGSAGRVGDFPLGLRAVGLAFVNPFTKRRVDIHAPMEAFLNGFGFETANLSPSMLMK